MFVGVAAALGVPVSQSKVTAHASSTPSSRAATRWLPANVNCEAQGGGAVWHEQGNAGKVSEALGETLQGVVQNALTRSQEFGLLSKYKTLAALCFTRVSAVSIVSCVHFDACSARPALLYLRHPWRFSSLGAAARRLQDMAVLRVKLPQLGTREKGGAQCTTTNDSEPQVPSQN